MILFKQNGRTCYRSKDKLDLRSQHYQALLIKRELTLQHFAAQISGHRQQPTIQQPTINEASGNHCFVSKPDRAIRVIWEPITEMELIIPITNVIRRENVAAHYQDSYAKESLSGKAMQPKAQSGPVTLYPIQLEDCAMHGKGVCRAAREPEDLEAYRVVGQPLCRTCQSRRAGAGWF